MARPPPPASERSQSWPLLRQAPVGPQNLSHDFALEAVRQTSAGLRQKAGDRPVDLPPAPGLGPIDQTPSQDLEPGGDAVCDWRGAIAAWAEIFAVGRAGHGTNLIIDHGPI